MCMLEHVGACRPCSSDRRPLPPAAQACIPAAGSACLTRSNCLFPPSSIRLQGKPTGRLLAYFPNNGSVHVLVRGFWSVTERWLILHAFPLCQVFGIIELGACMRCECFPAALTSPCPSGMHLHPTQVLQWHRPVS